MEAKINGGGPALKLRTKNGGITIERAPAGQAAMPPASVSSLPSDSATTGGQTSVLRIQVWQDGEANGHDQRSPAVAQDAVYQLPDSAREHMQGKGVDIEQVLKAVLKHPKIRKLVEIQDADSGVEIAIE